MAECVRESVGNVADVAEPVMAVFERMTDKIEGLGTCET
jgi:hypothetical protein